MFHLTFLEPRSLLPQETGLITAGVGPKYHSRKFSPCLGTLTSLSITASEGFLHLANYSENIAAQLQGCSPRPHTTVGEMGVYPLGSIVTLTHKTSRNLKLCHPQAPTPVHRKGDLQFKVHCRIGLCHLPEQLPQECPSKKILEPDRLPLSCVAQASHITSLGLSLSSGASCGVDGKIPGHIIWSF